MNKNYFATGANYYDHHKDITINVNGANPADIIRAALAEDVDAVQQEKPEQAFFCRITQEAYDKGKAQQVESELHSACVSAPKLIKAIRTNEALNYLDTQNLPSTELYKLLKEHYGLAFDVRAFQIARSK